MRIIIDVTTPDELRVALRIVQNERDPMAPRDHCGYVTFGEGGHTATHDTTVTKTKTGYSVRTRRINDETNTTKTTT